MFGQFLLSVVRCCYLPLASYIQERGNKTPLCAFLLASRPSGHDKSFRVQHLLVGTVADAEGAAADRGLLVVGLVQTTPGAKLSDVIIPADVRPTLKRLLPRSEGATVTYSAVTYEGNPTGTTVTFTIDGRVMKLGSITRKSGDETAFTIIEATVHVSFVPDRVFEYLHQEY